MTDEPVTFPDGDYAIAEVLGHRTLIGRVAEVERFGTKMLQIEPIFGETLLPPLLIGGTSLYAFTPCTAEVAFKKAPTHAWDLPNTLRMTMTPAQLALPQAEDAHVITDDEAAFMGENDEQDGDPEEELADG